jgi:hypothetical protein
MGNKGDTKWDSGGTTMPTSKWAPRANCAHSLCQTRIMFIIWFSRHIKLYFHTVSRDSCQLIYGTRIIFNWNAPQGNVKSNILCSFITFMRDAKEMFSIVYCTTYLSHRPSDWTGTTQYTTFYWRGVAEGSHGSNWSSVLVSTWKDRRAMKMQDTCLTMDVLNVITWRTSSGCDAVRWCRFCCLHWATKSWSRNVGILPHHYMASQCRRIGLESSPPWTLQVSLNKMTNCTEHVAMNGL